MRMLRYLEMRSNWRFRAKHVKSFANTLADGISRWPPNEIARWLHEIPVYPRFSCGVVSTKLRVGSPILGFLP